MPRIEEILKALKEELVRRLPEPVADFEPVLTRPPSLDLGDVAIAAFPLARALGRPPQEIAARWSEALAPGKEMAPGLILEWARPAGGFVNLRFRTDSLLAAVCRCAAEEGASFGSLTAGAGSRVLVEYSSPNTNKPLHLGHVRNSAIGMSLSNLLEAAGHEVVRLNLVNDRGIHICRSMLAYMTWGGEETPSKTGEKGDHFVGRYYVRFNAALKEEQAAWLEREGIDLSKLDRERREEVEERFLAVSEWMGKAQAILRRWEDGDPQILKLWAMMNEWVYEGFRETYERLGCRFDRWYFESATWLVGKAEVERGLAKGVFYRKEDGSVWAKLETKGLQDKLVLRSDGTAVYITQDIGTAVQKQRDYAAARSLYVVASEQDLHFRNLFAILELLGHPWASGLQHVSYGLVNLPGGLGKLKSREGTAVDIDELLDLLHGEARARIVEGGYCGDDPERIETTAEAIGQGAVKVYLLQVSNEKNIVFDPKEKLSFEGDTGPAIQYSHARICGIVRKGLERGTIREEDLVPATDAPAGVYAAVRPERVDYARLGSPEERELALRLLEFPTMIHLGWRQLSAAPVANHLLELTRAYARFYHAHRVLDAPEEATVLARLQLSLCVAQALRRGLGILTVEAPDRM
ncbi:MAG: arginine--tRNA ligase [Candidatus Eisenbacteria bacterium]